ncbi:hypothetical protein NKI56_12345 [Mesorhizobium sp. M0622]|uniref:hypothetical protein n=1 Tax=Mesorhizobium sp. M0622 TaxID=2956975 RepID=UPI00333B98D3
MFAEQIAEPPPVCDCPAGLRYLDYLSEHGAKVCDTNAIEKFHNQYTIFGVSILNNAEWTNVLEEECYPGSIAI